MGIIDGYVLGAYVMSQVLWEAIKSNPMEAAVIYGGTYYACRQYNLSYLVTGIIALGGSFLLVKNTFTGPGASTKLR